ncbi:MULTISPECIES: NADH-quinone oxidoreductase subunit L [unclassified Candidatus Frackibacter]|uniref:NADH-quinone oxidoreductase subunit L n=1 Tax=unclassified Candidatus Frackibacter TaxID=2648818 RepID=UPI0007997761|nr:MULTISPECIES: NADH-quinone oxidoreductase subunit L [unclassified Candidatus Frackibacter]KXS43049.1 MAG: NADH-quinone oxidoreductase subunit L [Candidatus Frackibacter sp. T328-2]SDC80713.1 NADH dehydrogenase subunit L [Candidatus Frackibacter sp. WG11]SEM93155.1 NADH dehydrogenase subunit L [Candidatus Frackibacter sp. WG12]SFM02717.1 NADH dehydrogenase subunit L [Candidatus Frackibacter sp. WG13]
MVEYAWLIPVLPLFSFLIIVLFGRYLKNDSDKIGIGSLFISFLLAIGVLLEVINGSTITKEFVWATHGDIEIAFGYSVDALTAMMFVVVTFVSLMVHVYSKGYMEGDSRYKRFYACLSLFTASMLGLVIANNLLLLFICWELVGLCSYLLIGHWFEDIENVLAANKAFLTTRVGDIGMLIGVIMIFAMGKTFNFAELTHLVEHGEIAGVGLTVATIFLFVGAIGKSAQFPLHVWLPDAMAGPTPVSALIHAATMVVAGVYLVARMFLIFAAAKTTLTVVAFIGGFTAIFAASIALVEEDIKGVLAYSTISQLGYMVLALGVGAYTAGVFHLMTHAFFKALLFLASGSVIHAVHTQNMHKMGGLLKKMKVTGWTWIIGSAALAGVPPFSGFWSKDEILLGAYHSDYKILFWIGVIAAFFTAFYITRATIMTFFGEPRDDHAYEHAHESPSVMTIPLILLAILAFGSGFVNSPLTDMAFGKFIALEHGHHASPSSFVQMTAVGATLSGIILGWLIYGLRIISRKSIIKFLYPVWRLLKGKYFIDEIYNVVAIRGSLALSKLIGAFDKYVVDGIVNLTGRLGVFIGDLIGDFDNKVVDGAVNGVRNTFYVGSRLIRNAHTGYLQSYALTLFFSVLIGLIIIVIGG